MAERSLSERPETSLAAEHRRGRPLY
jgi:hypothetical protein